MLLAAAMLLSMVPAIGASAANEIDSEGYVGNVKLLNNGESITLPIKINNFALDGMLFEYLANISTTNNSQHYQYENGGTYQLFTLYLADKKIGVDYKGDTLDGYKAEEAMKGVDLSHSMTKPQGTATQNYLGATSEGVDYYATLNLYVKEDGGGAKYMQLRQIDRTSYTEDKRAWRKLTRFSAAEHRMSQSRYAVIIYRVNGDTHYDDMLLTWDCYNELPDYSNCSQTVKIAKNTSKANDSQWQFAIVDLAYNLGNTEEERAAAAANTPIQDIYLKSPLHYDEDKEATGNSMDLAAVAYFPYYGDAEQFIHYGLTLGCQQKYYADDNRAFNLRESTRVKRQDSTQAHKPWGWSDGYMKPSVVEWGNTKYGNQLFTVGTWSQSERSFTSQAVKFDPAGVDGINTADKIGYALFGTESGLATVGLLEPQLDERGIPVYKEAVVAYIADFLQDRMTVRAEYPVDNYGWKNASFITGSSTTSGVDEALFGKDSLGHSIDLATALFNCVSGAQRNTTVTSGKGTPTGTMGTYAETRAKASELVGTWNECKDNIDTWFDAAYFLLHNLYVTDEDTAYDGDGYGEYEDDYQNMILPQVNIKDAEGNVTDAYFFDCDFAINANNRDTTAVIYDKVNHVLGLNTDANVTADIAFLPTSGKGTATGETNSPYYFDASAKNEGAYRNRDYLFTLSSNGSFVYERDLYFQFKGDDDVYLFINGQLVLDIGGTHPSTDASIYIDDYVDWAWSVKKGESNYKGLAYAALSDADRARVDALALEEGGFYSLDFFYMERHGAGSNLKIITNIEVTADGLNVDKSAYQSGIEVAENGIVDVKTPIEYGFKITNDSENKLYNLTFQDSVIGVSVDYMNGLQVAEDCKPYVRNASGNPLTVADLKILVTGKDASDNDTNIPVTCYDNEELKAFLTNLASNDGTQSSEGDAAQSGNVDPKRSGDGLWVGASVQIRGIYYNMTDAQKEIGSFRNYVSATANAEGIVLRGTDDHTVYQPGKPAYYQWAGHPVVIEREQLYHDLLDGVVASAEDLPALGNMILVPSDAYGVERQDNGLVNTRGGDVYLRINYEVPRSYIAYVTIRDQTDPTYRLTVPITVYVTDAKDTAMVLDYGLDSYLTDQEAIFDDELNQAVGENVTGTVMGIADAGITPDYMPYDTDSIETADGNTENKLALISGSYQDTQFNTARYKLDSPIYLEHTKPWVIEFEVGNVTGSSCLFSLEPNRGTDGNLQLNIYKTGNYRDFAFGYYSTKDGRSYDCGVRTDLFKANTMILVKLYNVIDGKTGTNMVYCSFNNAPGIAMDQLYHNGAIQSGQKSTWINGKDFTFKYIGCYGNTNDYDYGLKMNMSYLRVYEEGKQMVHYRWEKNGVEYKDVDTGKAGYTQMPIEHYTMPNHRWRNLTLTLNSDRAWEIEFEMQLPTLTRTFMLFSSTGSRETNLTEYVYIIPSKRFIAMGSDINGVYNNYGALLPSGFDLTASHTYLLKNRVNADGSNMVYLYVDKDENGVWTEVGPLNRYSLGANIGAQSNGLSGHDFNFKYVGGHDDFAFTDQVVSYIEVHEDTALRTAYEWKAEATEFANKSATSDGNRIVFTEDQDGVVVDDSGTFTLDCDRLRFETSDFMDQAYTTYVAMTIHDKESAPTPLNKPGVNVAKEVQMYKKVSVIPANVVYYEDDFPAIHYVTGNANVITSIGTSTLDQLQSPDQHTAYGSDEFYQNNFSNMSGDHIHTIKINEDDSCLAWFKFQGTGFELISSTNATDSAMIYIEVYDPEDLIIDGNTVTVIKDPKVDSKGDPVLDANGEPKMGPRPPIRFIPLIPKFDHGNNGGSEVIYQVPIIRWQREDDTDTNVNEALYPSEYVVLINAYATYDYSQSVAPMMDTYVHIDGIRIFQPMGYDVGGYSDVENKIIFDEVRNHIIDGKINACEKTNAGVIISSGTVTWTERFTGLDYTGTFFEGNKVNNVNDYLLKGPNNEVYMDGTSTESSLAFVVYRNPEEQYKDRELALQIGVRAIDVGNFYGTGITGMKANLEIGVTDASGNNSWMHLSTVSSGTEQYITVPYELCPAIIQGGNIEYHVVIRVSEFTEDIPAMVSFSGIKRTEGLELKDGIGEALTIYQDENGQWVTSQGEIQGISNFMLVRQVMTANTVIPNSDAVRGENFVNDTVVPESEPAILPKYPALSFEEEVQYHVFYTVQNLDGVALEDMGLITFDTENLTGTVSDAMDVIPGAVINGDQYVVHTNGISAKKLGDTLYFKVYAKLADGSYVYSKLYNYSAKTYAMNQLKGTNDAVKPLVVAMLNYGAAAQEFFGYNTDSLMNADLTADQQALVQKYHSDMATAIVPVDNNKVGTFVSNSGFTRMRPSVTFGGAFSINYFFTPAYALDGEITMYYWDTKTYNSVDELTVENALGSKAMVPVDGGEYFAAYTDIAAKKIGDTVYVAAVYESDGVTYCTGVLPYSLSLYCKRFAENSASPAQDLAAATMVYGYYAEEFFGG